MKLPTLHTSGRAYGEMLIRKNWEANREAIAARIGGSFAEAFEAMVWTGGDVEKAAELVRTSGTPAFDPMSLVSTEMFRYTVEGAFERIERLEEGLRDALERLDSLRQDVRHLENGTCP